MAETDRDSSFAATVQKLSVLRHLDISKSKITKACIDDLKQIKTLKTLILPRSFDDTADDTAKDELKRAIPGLKIY